jgi:ATP-dependent Clp protease ATP-binding subunit ClpB
LNRLISREIGNGLADKIIRGETKTGDKALIKINKSGNGLVVETAESLGV